MTHNTITVYTFLKTLINDHIKTKYPFLKSYDFRAKLSSILGHFRANSVEI